MLFYEERSNYSDGIDNNIIKIKLNKKTKNDANASTTKTFISTNATKKRKLLSSNDSDVRPKGYYRELEIGLNSSAAFVKASVAV